MKVLKPVDLDRSWLTLAATDATGDLLIRVELARWEEFKERGSDWMDSGDRQDLALGFVETTAAEMTPIDTPQGRVITIG